MEAEHTIETTTAEIDAALKAQTYKAFQEHKAKEAAASFAEKLPKILRGIGAATIIVAACAFLFQQWHGSTDIIRYYMLLGFTAALSLGGFLCGLKLQEAKGARTFLAIAGAIIPINFCALGALGYSRVLVHQGVFRQYLQLIHWSAPSDLAAISTTAIATVVLALLSFLSFSSLLRARARAMTGMFLLGNLALLVPTRQPEITACLLGVLSLGAMYFDCTVARTSPGIKTFEGLLARVLLTLPLVCLFGRTLTVYLLDTTAALSAVSFGILAASLFYYIPSMIESAKARGVLQLVALLPMTASWLSVVMMLRNTLEVHSSAHLAQLLLPIAFLTAAASYVAESSMRKPFRACAAYLSLTCVITSVLFFSGAGASVMAVGAGIAVLIYGYLERQRGVFFVGCGSVALGLASYIRYAFTIYSMSPWIILALIGVATVVASSFFEKYRDVVAGRFVR